jgi:hypothetical protein
MKTIIIQDKLGFFMLFETLIGGFALYIIIHFLVRAPGMMLQQKFVNLGTLAGKTKDEIIVVVGNPNSISGTPDGKVIMQWMSTGYHISLIFEDDICEGVSHEFSG